MSAEESQPRSRARRVLSEPERELWETVARQVRPLRSRPLAAKMKAPPIPQGASAAQPAPRKIKLAAPATQPPLHPRPPAPHAIDRRERRNLARGKTAIEARLDLHGMTQAGAHDALLSFLHRASARGLGYVLVITGKGSGDGRRGVLRRQVPLWLGLAEFRHLVGGFEEAHVGHGGAGALYVRIRRAR